MAGDLREQLLAVRDKYGGVLKPEYVVEAAQPPAHPLHSRFEWDNAIAGPLYRRKQAQELIQSVKIVYKEATENEPSSSVRFFQSIRRDTGFVYEPINEIAHDPVAAEILLREAKREWMALYRRFGHLREFIEMVQGDTGGDGGVPVVPETPTQPGDGGVEVDGPEVGEGARLVA